MKGLFHNIILGLSASIICLVFVLPIYGQTVDKATGAGSLSADSTNAGFVTLSGPVITETSAGQLSANSTLKFTLPSGWEWDTGGTAPTVTVTLAPGNNAITMLALEFTSRTASTITFTVTSSSNQGARKPGRATFGNFRIRPTNGTVPNSGTITNTGSTGPGGTTSYGDLSLVPGAATKIRVETAADGSGQVVPTQNITAGNSIAVYAISRDQFNNFIANTAADSWSLQNKNGLTTSPLAVASDGKSAGFQSTITGSAIIRAAKSGLNSVDSGTITVQPEVPNELFISTQPSTTVTAGATFSQQPVVKVLDIYGNIVTTNNTIQVTASRADGSGTLGGTKTLTVQNGIAGYTNLKHTVANDITIDFSASGFNKVRSDTITVVPAAPSKFIYAVQPQNGEQNAPLNPGPTVQITDAFGNHTSKTGTTINLTLNTAPSGAVMTGTTSITTDSSATFSNIQFDTNGEYTLNAVDGSGVLNTAVSNTFRIFTPGAVAKFSIVSSLSNVDAIQPKTAGENFNIDIKALDGSGNIVTSFTSQVILTSNGNLTGEPDTTGSFTSGTLLNYPVQITSTGEEIHLTAGTFDGSVVTNSNTFKVSPAAFNLDSSLVASDKSTLNANATSQTGITVQLRDQYGNLLEAGGETVVISTTAGSMSGTTDNGDGTYTAILTSSTTAQTATVTATVNGNAINDSVPVEFLPGPLEKFAVEQSGGGNIGTRTAGVSFDLRIIAQDNFGNTVTGFGGTVNISSTHTISSGGGTSAAFTNGVLDPHSITITQSGSATVSVVETGGTDSGTSNSFTVEPAAASENTTLITSARKALLNDGSDNTTVTVQMKDKFGNNLTSTDGNSVTLSLNSGAVASLSSVTANGDGTFGATLTASTTKETVTITGTLNATAIADDQQVIITEFNTWQSSGGGGPNPTTWNLGSNWSLGTVPTSDQLVIIPTNPASANKFPVMQSNQTLSFLEIQSGATVKVASGFTLTITQDITGAGALIGDNSTFIIKGDISISNFTAGTSTVTLDGTNAQQIPGQLSTNILNISNTSTGGITSSGYIDSNSLNISTLLNMQAGGELVGFGNVTGTGTLNADQATIRLWGDYDVTNTNAATSDLRTDGSSGTQTISNLTALNDLTVNNGSGVTFTGLLNASGTVTVTGSSILQVDSTFTGSTLSASGATIKVGGDLSFSTVSATPSTVEFIGADPQTLLDFDEFNNLTINKTANRVTAGSDVIVNSTLTLSSGDLVLGPGSNLLAPNRSLTGGVLKFQIDLPERGWYAISSPVASTYADFLDSTLTQGYTGSTLGLTDSSGDSLQPNLLYYDETYAGTDNQRWRRISNATDPIVENRGHFLYVFGDISGDSRYNNPAPDTLEVGGAEFTGDGTEVNFDVTYTSGADIGWNLVGNPYGATVDWDDDANWTKTNMTNTIYVWDHSANGGNGDYLVWNGFTGSLGNGLIAPFQAFWVKADTAGPVLKVHKDAKTVGGIFRNKSQGKASKNKRKDEKPPVIELKVEASELASKTYLSFTEDGSRWKDGSDAFRLIPFSNTFVEIFTTLEDGTQLAINNRPRKFGAKIEIPIHIGGVQESEQLTGIYTITWPSLKNIPPEWELMLEDRETGKKIDLEKESFYSFDVKKGSRHSAGNGSPNGSLQVVQKTDSDDARFVMSIDPGADAGNLPREFRLRQNYPNPFNPSTTIPFELPIQSRVTITVYDILGRRIATLADRPYEAGRHTVTWSPNALASGVYLFVFRTDEKLFTKKMTFIK